MFTLKNNNFLLTRRYGDCAIFPVEFNERPQEGGFLTPCLYCIFFFCFVLALAIISYHSGNSYSTINLNFIVLAFLRSKFKDFYQKIFRVCK